MNERISHAGMNGECERKMGNESDEGGYRGKRGELE